MDEEKAAAYYDEMRRKGGGAAKLKQGLGYGASSSPPPPSYRSFPSFVKGDDHSESLAKHEKESRLATVRDKLKKRPVEDDDADGHCDRRSREKTSKREHGNGHFAKGYRLSQSQDREPTVRSGTRRRHESRSSSSSSRDRRSRSRSFSSDSSYRKGGRHSHDRSISKREKRSRESLVRARRTSKSPRQSSRRSRSSSPRAHGSDNLVHSYQDSRKSLHMSHRSRSPYSERQRKSKLRKDNPHNSGKPNACDYSKLIPGYDNMTPAEKVKERMKLQLSETVSKDTARGMDTEWERFAFNKNAPLDDDAKLDYFGDGTGAQDDTAFLQNTGSTFLSTCSQAKREAQIQAAHDAAIFGPFTGLSSKNTGSYGKEPHVSPTKETTTDVDDDDAVVQVEAPPPINSLLSDQVSIFQQGSWRERALKLKQQRAASTIT